MESVGANPARIIPVWQSFLSEHARGAQRVRGIGEPIGPARTTDELIECHLHEALLNVAFADSQFWLLCPYDTRALDESVITEARHTHPYVRVGSHSGASAHFAGTTAFAQPLTAPLDAPPADARVIDFDAKTLRSVRRTAEQWARRAGIDGPRAADFVVSVSELSSNSVLRGGGHGTVRLWLDDGVVCEVRDSGHLTDPMLGRRHPGLQTRGGRGLWLANQLCDLVQVRSDATGTVVRLHLRAA
jgi:anti-sigma regulatory factor (Ser/Thr protein kinase)